MVLNKNWFVKFSGILFVLSPMLSNYVLFGPVSIGDFTIILSFLISLKYIKVSNFFVMSSLSSLLIVMLSFFVFSISDFIPDSFFRASFYLIVLSFFLSLKSFYYRELFYIYLKCSLVFSSLLIFQLFLYYALGVDFIMQLPIEVYELDTLEMIDFNSGGFRAAGVFKEPSYFAIFTIPALIYYSLSGDSKKYFFTFLAMMASTSSLGIGVSILSLIIFLISLDKTRRTVVRLIVILPIILFSFIYFMATSNNIGIIRFYELFEGGASLEVRFLNVFTIGKNFSFFVDSIFSKEILLLSNEWYNSFIYLVANFGLIFLISFAQFWKRIGAWGLLATALLLLFTHAFSNSFFTLFLVLFYFIGMEFPRNKKFIIANSTNGTERI